MNADRSTTDRVLSGTHIPEPEKDMPLKLSFLRWKPGCKAKQEPEFRFYALYDRIYRRDVLETAYQIAKKKDGSPGVDNVSFDDIEKSDSGAAGLIDCLREELRRKTYSPSPVRRTYITKENGKMRPLGIPCIRDRDEAPGTRPPGLLYCHPRSISLVVAMSRWVPCGEKNKK